MNPIKISVADPETLFRKGLCAMLEQHLAFELVGEATTGKELIQLTLDHPVDMVLMDVRITGPTGLNTLSRLRKLKPALKIVVISAVRTANHISEAIERGANSYIFKDADPQALTQALEMVQENGSYFTLEVSNIMASRLSENKTPEAKARKRLSSRDLEVLNLICNGLTNQEIANRLFLSKRTVEGYKRQLIQKTGGRSLTDAVLFGIRNGLVVL